MPHPNALPNLDVEQLDVLNHPDAALLVLGGPGSGKTTVVAHAAVRWLSGGQAPPLVLAGSRAAASSLRNRVVAALGDGSWQPTVTTVHALARSLWQRYGSRAELRLLAAPEQEFRVRELLRGAGSQRWPAALQPAVGTRGFAAAVRAALARARQLGLDPEDLVEFGRAGDDPQWGALGRFFSEYLDVLDAEAVIDYAELIHRVRLLLAEPEVAVAVRAGIGSVMVDDIADLDAAQLALVAALAGDGPLLATADPDSVSSGFRGAAAGAIADFAELARPGRPARTVWLTGEYRCCEAIAGALAQVRQRLPRPAGTGAPPPLVGAVPGGEVLLLSCAGQAEQAAAIVHELRRARLLDHLEYSEMAVVVRSGRRQLGPILRALVAAGIPVETAGDEIPLAQAPAVRPLLAALELAIASRAAPDAVVGLLTGPLGGFDAVGLRSLVRQWRAALPAVAPAGLPQQLAAAFNDPGWLRSAPATAATEALSAVVSLVASARELVEAERPVDEVAWRLWHGTNWPVRLSREASAGGALGARADADLDALCTFFELAAETDRRGGAAGVRAFLAEIGSQQIPADHAREAQRAGRGVRLLTAHRTRGLEWDLVVVAGVQEGIWPPRRGVSTILDPATLSPRGLLGPTDHRDLIAAERRLFHLACSRARRRLVVTAAAGVEGEADAPSRFLAELGVVMASPQLDGPPLTLSGLVAQLRRTAADAAVGPGLRDRAAQELAGLADAVDASGRALAPAADPDSWWGIAEVSGPTRPIPAGEPIRLSPSQLSGLLSCPRRYFLARQVRAEGAPGLAAAEGSLVHRLIQQSVEQDWRIDDLGNQLDAMWHHLPIEAGWFSATERVELESALTRFGLWRQTRSAELAGVEVGFRLELALDGREVVLEGKVDWLERTDDGLTVVDFKTARSAPTRAAVAAMEQLGVYQLAILDGCFAQVAGPVQGSNGASAVYLRVPAGAGELPRQLDQESLQTRAHLDPSSADYPTWVHQRVAAAARVVADGGYPATPGSHCFRCPFASSCPAAAIARQVTR